jgi:DNA-binding transcriptional ArsR family regulator
MNTKKHIVINIVPIETIVKSFANKTRIEILKMIKQYPRLSVEDITEKISGEYKNIASHIAKLHTAELVKKRYTAHKVLHTITPRGAEVLKFLRTLE